MLKKVRDVFKGGGDLQKNVHMTFLVDNIDMWRFPKTTRHFDLSVRKYQI